MRAWLLVIVDGVERSDPKVDFTVSFVRAADFGNAVAYSARTREETAHLNARIDATHAAVGLAFAIRDVERDATPMRYLELVVAPDKLRLVEVERLDRRLQHTSHTLGELPLDSKDARELAMSVRVGPAGVRGTVEGKPFAFPAPAERNGFVGMSFIGLGCATLTSFKVAP